MQIPRTVHISFHYHVNTTFENLPELAIAVNENITSFVQLMEDGEIGVPGPTVQ